MTECKTIEDDPYFEICEISLKEYLARFKEAVECKTGYWAEYVLPDQSKAKACVTKFTGDGYFGSYWLVPNVGFSGFVKREFDFNDGYRWRHANEEIFEYGNRAIDFDLLRCRSW